MDDTIPNTTEKKTDWRRIDKNPEIGSDEKEMVIERYEKVLNILKSVPILHNDDLKFFKYILDKFLEAYLKYIPNGPFFNDVLPTEIKENILNMSYKCDSKAFIGASVCQEWKGILENRLKVEKVELGYNWPGCKERFCHGPDCEEMLKAVATHKLDVHLEISVDVTEIDKDLVTDALTSVSKFTIDGGYPAYTYDLEVNEEAENLSICQFEHFFENISKGGKVMEEVKLTHLDLQDLNQDRLTNSLVSKIKKLTLNEVALDVETFIAKFQQDSVNLKLTHLTLSDFDFVQFPDNAVSASLGISVADALCKVENVNLCGWTFVFIKSQMMERLMENILHEPITMKSLIVNAVNVENLRFYCPDFESFINPEDLKTVFSKMRTLQLEGFFSLELLEAIRSLPDVEVSRVQIRNSQEFFYSIKKGSSGMF